MTKMNSDAAFDMIVIGGTGDLARRKLLPALYILHKTGEIPEDGRIFAVSRTRGDRDSYLADTGERSHRHIDPEDLSDEAWASFIERLDYVPMSATDPDAYDELKQRLAGGEDRVRIFYLATSPNIYGAVSQAIAQAGLITPETRIVLEKPIGHDLESAEEINRIVGEKFDEHQIYRIDHYLGKETVQNLMAVRFGNILFEPMWRCEHIDHVQITVAESIGLEGRGAYYDDSGALRDMIQNHLLQLLCIVAMEPPAALAQDEIREEKIKVLRALRPIEGLDVGKKTVRGQYTRGKIAGKEIIGYREEKGVTKDSRTETFVALKAEIDNWRWAGVPFYLRTGKGLGHKVSEIVLEFKQLPHLLFEDQAGAIQPNRLVIRLQPDEFIKLSLMTKSPGARTSLQRRFLRLNLADQGDNGTRTLLAYERLLLDVIRGVATLFIHRDEVTHAWRWVEPILDGWESGGEPYPYEAGTWGPQESTSWLVKDSRVWYEHLARSLKRGE